MKVRCVQSDVARFAVGEEHKSYFGSWFGRGAAKIFSSVEIGETYVVYTILEYQGYPFYDVRTQHPDDWLLVPTICFETMDARVSRYWHFRHRIQQREPGPERLSSAFAIREWIEDERFFERLVDRQERELQVWLQAVAAMDAEASDL